MLTMLFQQSSHSYHECRVCWCHIWWSGRRKIRIWYLWWH